ncbi:MBL fold metallo-hydrolase [Geitlerinema sp. PCC 9228]|jgi:glyoxylase-like metal-dependent hydrolase (beta-lactamase superfamily II)|uniref:MBL fold metallo-hydrolase n=1 Tax=Geitlerinema sp. PCC 9228 TaxID=111611 RepID=UPI0008F9B634|nr:MBL fold metallo-hydrolase [Geitlerinema sp. PCC 9228]
MPKQPRAIFDGVYAFPPNRDTLGGTAYFIVGAVPTNATSGNLLIDAPPWNAETTAFVRDLGGCDWLFLTNRDAMGAAEKITRATGCTVVVQEQEAYLLPDVEVMPFHYEFSLAEGLTAIWTPGYSPGSSCLYYSAYGGILFSGRHLVPDRETNPVPLRSAKTFHWRFQLRSIEKLRDRFTVETLRYICPGASTGFLRGKAAIDNAYERLAQLDLSQYQPISPLL